MSEQPLEPTEISGADGRRLVPVPGRQPVPTPSPERAIQIAARGALIGPVVAASLAVAAAAAAVAAVGAAAAATRMLWPVPVPAPARWTADPPEVFISYTRLEIYFPGTSRRSR